MARPTLGRTAIGSSEHVGQAGHQASQRSSASASRGENRAISSRRLAGSLASWRRCRGRGGRSRGPGVDLVAVAVQVEVAHHPLGHQADHVRQRGHLVAGPERLLGDGGAPDHLPGLADQRPVALLGQIGGRDQPVVPPPTTIASCRPCSMRLPPDLRPTFALLIRQSGSKRRDARPSPQDGHGLGAAAVVDARPGGLAGGQCRAAGVEAAAAGDPGRVGRLTGEDLGLQMVDLGDDRQQGWV